MRSLPILLLCLFAQVVAAADRPNVIFFLSDDQRADFLSCAGHPIVKTPNIDQLAAEGTRFTNAFVTTSICAASRATLLTGCWERTHKYTFGTPPIAAELTRQSYPALLKQAGYRTGFVGKFGVGVTQGMTDVMFDSFVPLNRNPYWKTLPDGTRRHVTNLEGDKAIEFVRSVPNGQPFCLSVSFNAAHAEDSDKVDHYPWCEEEDGLYEDLEMPQPLVRTDFWKELPEFFHNGMHRERWFWRWDTPEKFQHNTKAYFRMITGLDRNIGRVIEAVRDRGLSGNTIIIFMGDNGYYQGSRGFAGKWSHFEESLRVPLVISDPRVPEAQRGQLCEAMALNVDVPATIAAAALGEVPAGYQGRDLGPFVRGETVKDWRHDFFCEHLMDHPAIPKYEGVRGERYVYARYFQNLPEGEFLHDLQTDPQELKNLVSDPAYAEILQQMRARCDELREPLGGEYSLEKIPTVKFLREQSNNKRP
ncbi:MAG: sulfatase [Planctomycetaceae bacterium]|nr:sulfatase [Planctomycetaceae bacterium]